MPNLLVKPKGDHGRVTHVTPENAGWTYVGFDLHRVKAGETISAQADDREICLVWVSGKSETSVDGEDFGVVGERMSPFEGAPHALYVAPGAAWQAKAVTDLELAVCSAPGGGDFKTKLIPAGTHPQMTRGKNTNTRYVTNIMPEDDNAAQSLLVVEVITPGGHTSSYPPHKHDQDNLPAESFLEETYYHRLNPPPGLRHAARLHRRPLAGRNHGRGGWRRDAGAARAITRCAAIHGYDLYYLNVMAGPSRAWKFNNAKEHAWLFTGV